MRIISGKYGRRRFKVAATFNARPTTDFAKENLFNVLSNRIDFEGLDGLDLFSGTGSIAFEFLSRGCRRVTAVEKNNAHISFIAQVAAELGAEGLELVRGDAFRFVQSACPASYDVVFADPPYALPDLADVPRLVLEGGLVRRGGLFIMEHPKKYDFSSLPGFTERRVYGSVHFSIFEVL